MRRKRKYLGFLGECDSFELFWYGIMFLLFVVVPVVLLIPACSQLSEELAVREQNASTDTSAVIPTVTLPAELWDVEGIEWSISGYKFVTVFDPEAQTLVEGSLACAEGDIFFDYRSDMHSARALARYPRFLMEPLFKCAPVEKLTVSGNDFGIHEALAESGINPHYLTNFSYTLFFVSNRENRVQDVQSMLISESQTNLQINFLICMSTRA